MSSERQEVTLESLKANVKSAFAMGPFGSNIKAENFTTSGVPVIKGGNLGGTYLDESKFDYLRQEKADELSSSKARRLDLVITHRGTLGQVGLIPETSRFSEYVVSQSQLKLSFDHRLVDPYFVYYFFKSPLGQERLLSNTSQVGVPAIAQALTTLRQLKIPLPSLFAQRAVTQILRSLDDRITLLRETNTTLEAIAQALFKSWFVDFDPVHAKMQGRAPEGMDEATAALFPGSFEESELGAVPKGWRVGTLADLATFQNGYAFKSKDWSDAGHPVIKIGNVKPSLISFDGCSFVSAESVIGLDRFKLRRGDLLVGMTGYVGVTGLVTEVSPAAYLNQRVGRIATSAGGKDQGFVFCLTRHEDFKAFAEGQSHGSAQANVSGSDLLKFKSIIPDKKVIQAFNEVMETLIESIMSNHEKTQALGVVRDLLLPRLISGFINLAEIENVYSQCKDAI
jgi:type I restriction enzyme, S subunit